ncbi:MAG TPA: general secretion pathway protein GspB [Geobacteraceae bacterium]|nr:general secretion pathway protein GspB [Geobacteraceae bacterium]
MSSILEALKKLEDEKAARLSGAGNIAGKVLKAGRRPRQKPVWLLPAGMVMAAMVAAAITYGLMGGFTSGKAPAPTPPPAVAPLRPQPTQAPVAATSAQPVSLPAPVSARATRRASAIPKSPSSPAPRREPVTELYSRPSIEPRHEERSVAPPPAAVVEDTPSLKVSGIAWQKDGADRLAVVNGRTVAEGGVIEGARVDEIFPDRVRFSHAGRKFEVTLGKIPANNP